MREIYLNTTETFQRAALVEKGQLQGFLLYDFKKDTIGPGSLWRGRILHFHHDMAIVDLGTEGRGTLKKSSNLQEGDTCLLKTLRAPMGHKGPVFSFLQKDKGDVGLISPAPSLIEQINMLKPDHIIADDRSLGLRLKEFDVSYEKTAFYEELEEKWTEIQQPLLFLPGGGSLEIYITPSLTHIDVNGEGATFRSPLEMNKKAALAIERYLRLADIGGMVSIDFLRHPTLKNQLFHSIKDKFKEWNVYGFTRMGLFELSKPKINTPLPERIKHLPLHFS